MKVWKNVVKKGALIRLLHHAAGRNGHDTPIPKSVFTTLGFARPAFHILPRLEKLEWYSTQYLAQDETDFFGFLSPSIRELSFHLDFFSQLFIRDTIARID